MQDCYISHELKHGVALITLNRPAKHNALNAPMIEQLTAIIVAMSVEPLCKVLVFNAAGPNFCAGADLKQMQTMAHASIADSEQDARQLAQLLYTLYQCPKPTLCLVQGTTLGGGLGIIAACDIAIAERHAKFAFPEVKRGLIPAIISPYIVHAIGHRLSQYYFLSAKQFACDEAKRIHLIHRIEDSDLLQEAGLMFAHTLLDNSPQAMHAVKLLLANMSQPALSEALISFSIEQLVRQRQTLAAKEGLQAFLDKRPANWDLPHG
jgi:methylglutaconyl-CoA hydratase